METNQNFIPFILQYKVLPKVLFYALISFFIIFILLFVFGFNFTIVLLWCITIGIIVFNFKHKFLSHIYFNYIYKVYLFFIQKQKKINIYFCNHFDSWMIGKIKVKPLKSQNMAMYIFYSHSTQSFKDKDDQIDYLYDKYKKIFQILYENYTYIAPFIDKKDKFISWMIIEIFFIFFIFSIYLMLSINTFAIFICKFPQSDYLFLIMFLFINIVIVVFLALFFVDIFHIKDNYFEKKIERELKKIFPDKDKYIAKEYFLKGFLINFYYKNNKINIKGTENHHFLPGLGSSIYTNKLINKDVSNKIFSVLPTIVATIAILTTFNIFINIKHDIDCNRVNNNLCNFEQYSNNLKKYIKRLYEKL